MRILFIILALPSGVVGSPDLASGSPSANRQKAAWRGRDLAAQVRTLFTLKCTECHGAALRRPRGRFGNVEDLKRVAGDPKLVVPFHAGESKLWQLIRDNEMPPERSRAGALTPEQKDVVRAWIETGAVSSATARTADAIGPDTPVLLHRAADETTQPFSEHLLRWLGKFHVAIVHFPIALLVVAAVVEVWSLFRRNRETRGAVRLCVLFAAAGAAAATALGWLEAAFGGYTGSASQTLTLHRWTGTSAGLLAVIVAALSELEARRGVRTPLFRVTLLMAALLVGVAGHLGGILVYGDSYFNW
jgi:uncharacterized membrane protein